MKLSQLFDRTGAGASVLVRGWTRTIWAVAAVSLLALPIKADDSAKKPTAALILDTPTPAGLLLESKLLAGDAAQWLEREDFEKLVGEQQLSASLQSAGLSQRIALGKLLKADVLVILRRIEKPMPHFHLVVAETKRGLRLLVHSVIQGKDAEADATALERSVQQALDKQHAEILDVCAVPSLVSDNLSYEYEHLKSAYAKVIERSLSRQPGLLLVELEEAQTLSKELAIRGDDDRVRRRMPLYVLGRFRHFVEDNQQKVRVGLTFKRGEAIVAKKEISTAANDATQQLRDLVSAMANRSAKARVASVSSKTEAKLLAEQSLVHQTVGNWREAAALAEASLLLDPTQLELRGRCVAIYSRYRLTIPSKVYSDARIVEGLLAHSRGLDHLEIFLQKAKDIRPYRRVYGGGFLGDFIGGSYKFRSFHNYDWPTAVKPLAQQVKQKDLQTAFRVARMRVKAGFDDSEQRGYYRGWVRNHVADDKLFEFVAEHFDKMADVPDAVMALANDRNILIGSEGETYVQRYESSKDPDLRAVGHNLRSEIERLRLQPKRPSPFRRLDGPASIPPDQPLQFRNVDITVEPKSRNAAASHLTGVTRVGETTDAYWGRTIYLMKEKGKLCPVVSYKTNQQIPSASFDGKYLWAVTERHFFPQEPPSIVVVDPKSEKTWELTHKDGLPLEVKSSAQNTIRSRIRVYGYAPGKACITGWFGRSWVALVEFDPLNGVRPRVKTILEANVVRNRDAQHQIQNPKLVFQSVYIAHVKGKNSSDHGRLLIGRGGTHHDALYYPLVVDLAKGKVTLLKNRLPLNVLRSSQVVVKDDAVYIIAASPKKDEPWLYRLSAPDFKAEPVASGVPPGDVVFFDGRTYICGRKWYELDTDSRKTHELGITPWYFAPHMSAFWRDAKDPTDVSGPKTLRLRCVGETNHYGLVALIYDVKGKSTVVTLKFKHEEKHRVSGEDMTPSDAK